MGIAAVLQVLGQQPELLSVRCFTSALGSLGSLVFFMLLF